MAKLRTLLALDRRDRGALFRAWAWLCFAKAALAVLGLRRTLSIVAPARAHAATPTREHGAREAKWNSIAARYVPGGASCLVRSLGLVAVLRRRGLHAELRIGVGDRRPALDAHAWVEVGGVPVNDSADVVSRYRAFGGRSPAL
jgi:hypothetical protein